MSDLKARIQGIRDAFNQALDQVEGLKALEELRNQYLGRKRGIVKDLLADLRTVSKELRPELGQAVNRLKNTVENALTEKLEALKSGESTGDLQRKMDLTLPGVAPELGSLHPLKVVNRDLIRIFERMGYEVASASEIETDFYNFEALGLTKNHPARDMQDTFYVTDEVVLRTHTSNVQIHLMQESKPPFKAIMPGRVYRKDADITHSPMFHQVEGLVVGEQITFADLKGTLEHFLKQLFGSDTKMRLRPSYFPFTEPSAEVDVSCIMCGGKGCRVCKNSGWLEILGAGMVDPVVFKNVGYDPEVVSGFAFGLGVERVAMLKYGISDIRMFFEDDLRFLSQFT
ncbi:MAG: phenylalanine--tRNA ligase subunit alpha [Acidobacteria bacterium]|nr:phenylalanine--tRNA ligase subunit alpha [Acidobacteriota bacterium]